ncbi:hypothetical protein [Streptomyces sp. DW26H14]|uniref:hypothetical protein n=1 Tax=Streptomyces sp. DW26H14 TaxID=3435395 RepID=UPI00403E1843
MFDIRIICDADKSEQALTALSGAFTLTETRQYPARDGNRVRLYTTATPDVAASPWPTPENAYDKAPSIVTEITWVTRTAHDVATDGANEREYFLRKAAVFDRIALVDEPTPPRGTATDTAMEAAFTLLDLDQQPTPADPRGYVRRQYQHWREQQQRADRIAAGRCPNCKWLDYQCNCADHPNA